MTEQWMISVVPAVIRITSVLVIFAPGAAWYWFSGRWPARGDTFFSVRVPPGFAGSPAGRAIVKTFRRRVWLWTLSVATVYVIAAVTMSRTSLSLVVGQCGTMAGGLVAFAMAYRTTRADAGPSLEPRVRTAPLFADDEPGSVWLTLLDFVGMVFPLALPLSTAMFLGLHMKDFPASARPERYLIPVVFAVFFGFVPAATQFALRFGARSSDWAPGPHASRKYRTFLGFMQAVVFTFIILQICLLSMMPLPNAAPFRNMFSYFRFLFPAYVVLYIFLFKMRAWLKTNFAPASVDPMPDDCWKWGSFYFNSTDPALVVPMRSGTSYSFNYARRSVWLAGGTVVLATLASLVHSVGMFAQVTR